jgi:type IV pilus assembly protein PilC
MSPVVRTANVDKPTTNTGSTSCRHAARKRAASDHGHPAGTRRIPGARKIAAELLPPFSRKLAAMLSAGMSIVASLKALQNQAKHPGFKTVITEVKLSIEDGCSFSEALRQFPSVFDDLYSNMIKGGETGGQLAETIARLAQFLEASVKLKRRVKSAMMYPTVVLCIALGIAAAMITFVVPVFAELFASFGEQLPGPTHFLLMLSYGMKSHGLYIIVAVAALIFAFKKWKTTANGAYTFDLMLLRVPVAGDLMTKLASARFARTFAQLIRSGVPILTVLKIVSGATGNRVIGQAVRVSGEVLERGEPLSGALAVQKVFPDMLIEMLQAGEKTGRIDEMMDCIADFYDDEIDAMLAGLTSLLEPFLMVILGVIIGGIVLCMFLPMFQLPGIIGK